MKNYIQAMRNEVNDKLFIYWFTDTVSELFLFSGLVWYLVWDSILIQVFNLILVDSVPNSRVLQKVNMCYLSKATQEDKSLKTGLIKTNNHQPTDHRPTNQPTHRPTNHFPLTQRPTKHLPTDPSTGRHQLTLKQKTRF